MKSFSWQTPEYLYRPKTSDWYSTVGILTAAFVVTAIILGNALFGVVIAIGAFSLTLFASRKPSTVSVSINDKGIFVGKTLYPYASLDSFGIDEAPHRETRLLLKSKKVVMPLIAVPVEYHDLDELREFLLHHLKEEVFEQSFLQTVFERLGF